MIPIEKIQVGDRVLAKDELTGSIFFKTVLGLFRKTANHFYKGYIDHEILNVTGEHPLWLDGKGWTLVKDLKVFSVERLYTTLK